ncbi:MAG TPA: homoserine kinase [Polyangiaceae bacterium]
MALLTPLSLAEARTLGLAFGIEIERLEALSLGSVNSNFRVTARDGGVYFARLYEEQGPAGAASELALLGVLARAGVPVPAALPLAGEALPEHAGKPFALFPWIAGESLCLQRVSAEACRTLGAALARVHGATAGAPRLGPGRFGPADMLERLARVRASGAKGELLRDVERARALYARLTQERDPGLPSGIVHGDLFRDNVLWHEGRIAALLDFESVSHGPFVYDLLVTIAAWCYRSSFELDHARALVTGYESVRPLSPAERRAVRTEGPLACLRFVTSRITDFELRAPPGTPPLRDYRRFLARLEAIEAGALDGVFSA